MNKRWLQAGAALIGAACLVGSGPVGAGDLPPPTLESEVLDALRALIPEGSPGEYDQPGADALYDQIGAYLATNVDVQIGDGSKLEGVCGGFAFSYNKKGERIDAAYDAGTDAPPIDLLDGTQAFTASNPFQVDTEGLVTYYGFMPRSGDGPLNHRWKIATGGVSLDSGGDPNTALKNLNVGIVDLAEDLPVKFAAKAKVKGDLKSENIGTCIGEGHVEFTAPFANPFTLGSIAALGGGVLGLLFNSRPARTFKGSV